LPVRLSIWPDFKVAGMGGYSNPGSWIVNVGALLGLADGVSLPGVPVGETEMGEVVTEAVGDPDPGEGVVEIVGLGFDVVEAGGELVGVDEED